VHLGTDGTFPDSFGGWPTFGLLEIATNEGAPSLRSLQGWEPRTGWDWTSALRSVALKNWRPNLDRAGLLYCGCMTSSTTTLPPLSAVTTLRMGA